MPYKSQTWCVYPCHNEVLPNGKKCFWTTRPKSERFAEDVYLCSTCFDKEQTSWIADQRRIMDVGDCHESCDYNKVDNEPNYHQDSPMDDDCVHYELEDVKKKLNYVFEFVNVQKIDDL